MSRKAAADKMRAWIQDPHLFIRDNFQIEEDEWQYEATEAFRRGEKRIALAACKGPGKSAWLAWMILYFLATRPHPKIVCTSITAENLRDGLWAEISKWMKKSDFLDASFKWTAERVYSVEHPQTWWASARTWPKDGDPSQQANTLAGIHADYVLFVIDEAGGVPEGVAAAAEAGLSTGIDTRFLIAGNPTHREGPLFNACFRDRAHWWVKSITADPEDPKRSKRISIEWAQQQIDIYGRDNPWVMVNVFGLFPPSSSDTLLSEEEVEEAAKRWLPEDQYIYEPKVLGVDVARYGTDRTVITMRQGRVAYRPEERRGYSTRDTAGLVTHLALKHKPDAIFVDGTGIGGGVVDQLVDLHFPVISVESAGRSPDPRCLNMRAYMWIQMTEWVKSGGCIPNNADLKRELARQKYKFSPKGQWQIVSKEEMRKEYGASSDYADSLGLTFAFPVLPRKDSEGLTHSVETDYDPFNR